MPIPSDEAILQRLLLLLCSADATNRDLGLELARSQGWDIEEEMQFERWRALRVEPFGLFGELKMPYQSSPEQFWEALELLRAAGQDGHTIVLQELKALMLYGGGLQAERLPAVVEQLRGLVGFALHRCHLRRLPEELGELPHLRFFICDWLSLEEIPAWAHRFAPTYLDNKFALFRARLPRRIDLLGMRVGHIRIFYSLAQRADRALEILEDLGEDIYELPNLLTIRVTGSRLRFLSAAIGNAKKLQKLFLHNNQLEALPAALADLQELLVLDLSNNQIESIEHPIAANDISLNGNPLAYIGDGFAAGELCAQRLEQLELMHTKLQRLPDNFGLLVQLRWLRLDNTQLSDLPASFGRLQDLQNLSMNYTPLRYLPAALSELSALYFLGLRRCQIVQFCERAGGVFMLPTLIKLDLSHNHLLGMSSEALRGRLKGERLLSLSLRACNLRGDRLGEDFFAGLPKLSELDLSGNKALRSLPTSFFGLRYLRKIDLRHTRVVDILSSPRWQQMQFEHSCEIYVGYRFHADKMDALQALLPSCIRLVRK